MRLHISAPGLRLTGEEREHIEQRLRATLPWPAHALGRVALRLRDVNGPRGGVDKSCVVRVALRDGPEAVIEDRDEDLRRVVDRATHRAGRLVARLMRRLRPGRRGPLRASMDGER